MHSQTGEDRQVPVSAMTLKSQEPEVSAGTAALAQQHL